MMKKNNAIIDKAVQLLKVGEIVALPTETVYGLAGNALDPCAIAKIFEAKSRPQDNPLIVHVSDIEMLRELGLEISELALKLAEKFWPGPLTMVLKKIDDIIPSEISCGFDSVAVRVPNSRIMLEIIKRCGFPVAAPSANLSGRPSPTTVQHVRDDIGDLIDLIVDGGNCEIGIESTVISFVHEKNEKIRVLRPGAVTVEMLSEFADVVVDDNGSPLSPGTRYKHYSPKAEVIAVIADSEEAFRDYVGESRYVIACPEMQTLFATFREFDEQGAEQILVHLPEPVGVGLALHNRIIRAAEFNVIRVDEKLNVVGLTGISGAGKSTAAKFFAERGFYVIDCDKEARTVITSSPCIDEVREIFSEVFVDGVFNRKKAADVLFSNSKKLEKYQKLVFPYVVYGIIKIIESSKSLNILLDASTLYQSGADDFCNKIIAVVADKQVCVKRITERDNISQNDALLRLSNQPNEEYYRSAVQNGNADYIIENNEKIEDLFDKVNKICKI